MSTLTASLEERVDQTTLRHIHDDIEHNAEAAKPAPVPQGRLAAFLEDTVAKRFGQRSLAKLAAHRGSVASAWQELPNKMRLVANQTELMMELVDDFRTGKYRHIPWRSLAVCTAAILYTVSPADLVPDVLVGVGLLDDLAVVAIASRFIRDDLKAYCEFKGYDVAKYFAEA
jgi:uncharacterized membrane protein YkvA (DUF1232 family)